MATSYRSSGNNITVAAPTGGTITGVGVLINDLFGVASNTVAVGVDVALITEGVVEIAKTSALAIDVGEVVYWDDTGKEVDLTAASQKPVGIAVADSVNPSPTALIKLTPNITAA